MATWKIEPTFKKSVVERQLWTKDGHTITHEIGWRWGEFVIETEGDEKPELNEDGDIDLFSCGYELQDFSTNDGCWEETDFNIQDDDTKEKLELFLEENSVFDLEDDGWEMTDSEMWITCPITIEKVD